MTDHWKSAGELTVSNFFGIAKIMNMPTSLIIGSGDLRAGSIDCGPLVPLKVTTSENAIVIADVFGDSYTFHCYDMRQIEGGHHYLLFRDGFMPDANESTNDEGVEFAEDPNLGELTSDGEEEDEVLSNFTFLYPDNQKLVIRDVIEVDADGDDIALICQDGTIWKPRAGWLAYGETYYV